MVANEARYAVDFGAFFSCEDGATPEELLRGGIYTQIAIALKGGAWRRASLVVLAQAIARTGHSEDFEEAPAKSSWRQLTRSVTEKLPEMEQMRAQQLGAQLQRAAANMNSHRRVRMKGWAKKSFEMAEVQSSTSSTLCV